jgi:branched-chain amino acid transport system permease protein
MVIMGGIGTLFGPVLGATAFLLLEEYLPGMMDTVIADSGVYWQIVLGSILIFLVLFARRGILGILSSGRAP